MMISVILLSLSMCLDNVIIGLAYGIKKIKIGIISNMLIAFITTLGTIIFMILGSYLKFVCPIFVTKLLGSIIIMILGLFLIIQHTIKCLYKKSHLENMNEIIDYAQKTDFDKSGDIDLKEAIFVSFGLMLNNLSIGILASIAGISIYLTAIFTFAISIITIRVGVLIGKYLLGNFFGKYATLMGGILLIILGIINIINSN